MLFSVQELEHRDLSFDVAYQPGEIEFAEAGEDLTQAGSLEVSGVAKLVGSVFTEIRVSGHLRVTLGMICDRCLETVEFPINSDFDLYYRPVDKDSAYRDEMQIDEGQADIAFYEGEGVELEDVLREFVLLSLPMQKTCRPDCKGMCPGCGVNRNRVQCECRQEIVDERWSALRKL
jgi:uncharacterized protein